MNLLDVYQTDRIFLMIHNFDVFARKNYAN
jgi:hypothetical protein